ncbi:MAG: hypothetical protein LBQ62_02735 [Candidatus Accumulibacter sp.]|jgi:hypothetical protein|nr:hypothetical protein [Accumulibacter sp.]
MSKKELRKLLRKQLRKALSEKKLKKLLRKVLKNGAAPESDGAAGLPETASSFSEKETGDEQEKTQETAA